MKKILSLTLSLLSTILIFSQTPDDILKYSNFIPNGTSRFNGVAGSMSAIGGDISSLNTNPAGLGFIRKFEIVGMLDYFTTDWNNNYRGNSSKYSSRLRGSFPLGGIAFPIRNTRWSFGFSINQLANYNRTTKYSGFNNYSSITNSWLESLQGQDTNFAYNQLPFGASLAYLNYLIDTSNAGPYPFYKTLVPYNTLGTLQQVNQIESGGLREWAFGVGGQVSDKVSLGISIIIPSVNYYRTTTYSEDKTTNDSGFQYLDYVVNYSTVGSGIGAKLGVIYKPIPRLNLGLSIHTPQTIYLSDEIDASLSSNVGNYDGFIDRTSYSSDLNNGNSGQVDYIYRTPAKFQINAGYIFGNIKDFNKLKGFVSGEVEYVTNTSAAYISGNEGEDDLSNYFEDVNSTIQNYYRNTLNYKIGVELSISGWAFRGGYAAFQSPYSQSALNKNGNSVFSLGLGYHGRISYIDLSYGYITNNSVNFPYRVSQLNNTYANLQSIRSNFTLTYGIRF
ncbi:MAG: hypothetical protein QM539_06650 [Alphaproteobacteria bacterium]|nr:hypothetical protein [Alphaproteobacteria bacterium]